MGISARVLKDIGRGARTVEARTVLGAAVIDDVIGLLVLSLVTGWAAGRRAARRGRPRARLLLLKTAAFFGAALTSARASSPACSASRPASGPGARSWSPASPSASSSPGPRTPSASPPSSAPSPPAWCSRRRHWRAFVDRGERGLDQEIEPLNAFLVPLFFALLGVRTDLRAFADPTALALALGLTLAALLGKLACGLGAARGSRRLAVSFGMMPRGEVSLVFASLGLSLARRAGARPPRLLGAGDDGGADDARHAAGPQVELRARGRAAERAAVTHAGVSRAVSPLHAHRQRGPHSTVVPWSASSVEVGDHPPTPRARPRCRGPGRAPRPVAGARRARAGRGAPRRRPGCPGRRPRRRGQSSPRAASRPAVTAMVPPGIWRVPRRT